MKTKNTDKVLWCVAGAALGAGVALLYAPRAGEETRKYLRKTAGQARDRVVETGESLAGQGRILYDRGARAVEGAAGLLARGRKWVMAWAGMR